MKGIINIAGEDNRFYFKVHMLFDGTRDRLEAKRNS